MKNNVIPLNSAEEPDVATMSNAELLELLGQSIATADWVQVLGTKQTHTYDLSNKSRKVGNSFHEAHGEKLITYTDSAGNEKTIPLTQSWLRNPFRQRVDNYSFNPSLPSGFIPPTNPRDKGVLNLWPGIPDTAQHAWSRESVEAYKVNRAWQRFMRKLFGSYWKWVALWVGQMLNHPDVPTSQAVMLLTTVQGIGKSLFGEILIELLGGKGGLGTEIKAKDLGRNFNVMMEGKILAVVNELDNKFDNKESELNDLITAVEIFIEPKGMDQYPVTNFMRYYFTTNSASPCRLSPKQRRILVISPELTSKDGRGRWNMWVSNRIAGYKRDARALGAIRQWFDDLWVAEGEGKWSSTAPVPMTQASLDAAESSMCLNDQTAHRMLDYVFQQGWVVVHAGEIAKHSKVWGAVKGLVRAEGGRVLVMRETVAGREIRHCVLDANKTLGFSEKLDKAGHVSEVRLNHKLDKNDVEKSMMGVATKMYELLDGGGR